MRSRRILSGDDRGKEDFAVLENRLCRYKGKILLISTNQLFQEKGKTFAQDTVANHC